MNERQLSHFGVCNPYSDPSTLARTAELIGSLADEISGSANIGDIDEHIIRGHLMAAYNYIHRVGLARHS